MSTYFFSEAKAIIGNVVICPKQFGHKCNFPSSLYAVSLFSDGTNSKDTELSYGFTSVG